DRTVALKRDGMANDLDPIPDYIIEDRLKEWARWARTKQRQLHCASIEHKWDSDWWNGWRDNRNRPEQISLVRAAQIEAIICYLGWDNPPVQKILVSQHVW